MDSTDSDYSVHVDLTKQGICFLLVHSVIFSSSAKKGPDQTDLGLHSLYIYKDTLHWQD